MVLVVLLWAVVLLVIKPLMDKSGDLNSEIEMNQERLTKGLKVINSSDKLEKEYQNLISVWGVASSDASEASELVSKLEDTASLANVHIMNMEPQAVIKDGLARYPIDITIDGQWPAMVRFLYLVQNQPLMLNIESMNLEKTSDGNSTLRGKITVSRLRIIR